MFRAAVAVWLLTAAAALAQGRLITAYTLYGETPQAVIAISADQGETWREVHRADGLGATVRDLAAAEGVILAVTEHEVLRSADGQTWAAVAALATDQDAGDQQPKFEYHGVGYGDGVFVVVGSGGLVLISSDQGESWQRLARVNTAGEPAYGYAFHDAAFGDGRWVLGGPYQQLTALRRDGDTWTYGATHRGSETSWSLNAKVAWGGGRWLGMTTEDSQVWQSSDGLGWQDTHLKLAAGPAYPAVVCDAAYGEVGGTARWALCFLPGRLASSEDRESWEIGGFTDRGGNQQGYLGICYADGKFIAAGHDNADGPALLTAVCRDGRTWQVTRRAVAVEAASGPIVWLP